MTAVIYIKHSRRRPSQQSQKSAKEKSHVDKLIGDEKTEVGRVRKFVYLWIFWPVVEREVMK